jgi:hypothetical protein
LLRYVEALRLYAARHDGKLPAKGSDLTVPPPIDPVTGKPFVYTAEGTTAHLRGGTPPGKDKSAAHQVHYIVTVRK